MPAVDMFRPAMRGYFIPLAAGLLLTASTFLPWVVIGDTALSGMPDVPALWVAGLGALAAVLAALSLITRRNSRHPLLVIGLVALGIMFLSWRIMPRVRRRTRAHAHAGVRDRRGHAARRRADRPGRQRHLCRPRRLGGHRRLRPDDRRQARVAAVRRRRARTTTFSDGRKGPEVQGSRGSKGSRGSRGSRSGSWS